MRSKSETARVGENTAQLKKKHSLKKNEPLYSRDGVDLTLIRWMLSLTPTQRLDVLKQNVRSLMRLRSAKARF